MENADVVSSLQKALENVERASQANEKEDEAGLDLSLWRAFSEIEYISFLASIKTGENKPVQTRRKIVKQIDIGSSLIDARDSLLESLKLVKAEGLSIQVGDKVEKAKTSVFNAIRKQTSRNRQQEKRRSASKVPSSASVQ